MFSNFFLETRAVYDMIMPKNMAEPERPQTIQRRRSYTHTNTHTEKYNTYSFLTATMIR